MDVPERIKIIDELLEGNYLTDILHRAETYYLEKALLAHKGCSTYSYESYMNKVDAVRTAQKIIRGDD